MDKFSIFDADVRQSWLLTVLLHLIFLTSFKVLKEIQMTCSKSEHGEGLSFTHHTKVTIFTVCEDFLDATGSPQV